MEAGKSFVVDELEHNGKLLDMLDVTISRLEALCRPFAMPSPPAPPGMAGEGLPSMPVPLAAVLQKKNLELSKLHARLEELAARMDAFDCVTGGPPTATVGVGALPMVSRR